MSKIIAYKKDARHCFSQIRFDSREKILISVANNPAHSIKVIKLFAGIIPYKTVWEYSLPEGAKNGPAKLISLFADRSGKKVDHPLDAITTKLLTCRSCSEAVRALQQAERS
ncbi:MAG: hypothetical protein HZA15_05700 [Nitrospirae bacterium]|nr:hypothetical protein [Nitrospirota bacterium]